MGTTAGLGVLLAVVASLSPIYHFVRKPQHRHLLSILGICALYAMYGFQCLNIIGMFLYCYLVVRFVPAKYAPHVFFTLGMIHQTYGQVYRYFYEYLEYSLDWSLSGMLMTLRLAGALWSRRDGKILAENKDAPLSRLQIAAAIDRDFTFLELFGFAFYFPGVMVGPFGDIKQYLEFIEFQGIYEALLPESEKKTDNKRVTLGMLVKYKPLWFRIALLPFSVLSTLVIAVKYIPEAAMYNLEFRQEHGFLFRVIYAILAIEFGNGKYYFTWSAGEVGTIISGLSFNGFNPDGSLDCEGNVQLQLINFKTITEPKDLSKYWSMSPQHYLKKDVFDRIKSATGSYLFASFATFFFSAFWHGVYPGYYMFFFHAAAFSIVLSDLKANIEKRFLLDENKAPKNPTGYKVFLVICCLITNFTLDYVIIPFRAMSLERSLNAWGSLYFIGHIISAVALVLNVVFKLTAPRKPPKTKNSE